MGTCGGFWDCDIHYAFERHFLFSHYSRISQDSFGWVLIKNTLQAHFGSSKKNNTHPHIRNFPMTCDGTTEPTISIKTHSCLNQTLIGRGKAVCVCVCCGDNSWNNRCFACDLSRSCCQEGLIKSPITLI